MASTQLAITEMEDEGIIDEGHREVVASAAPSAIVQAMSRTLQPDKVKAASIKRKRNRLPVADVETQTFQIVATIVDKKNRVDK